MKSVTLKTLTVFMAALLALCLAVPKAFAADKRPQVATLVVWVEDTETGEKVIPDTTCRPHPS